MRDRPLTATIRIKTEHASEETISLKRGETLRVGRAAPADLVVAEDHALSRLHFELHFDGKSCWLRDLNSTNGTVHNGNRIMGGQVRDGDVISAGRTRFTIGLKEDEATTSAAPIQPSAADLERLLAVLRTELQPLYAVLDLSQGPDVLKLVLESRQPYYWLFQGDDAARLMPFSPLLVALPPESPLLDGLVRLGWSNHWCILINSHAGVEQLQQLFRWLLQVTMPDGSASMLRFYDPRVLRALLPTCTAMQLQQLFSGVRHYITEGELPEEALGFSLTQQGLQRITLSLAGKPPEVSVTPPVHGWQMNSDRFALTPEQKKVLQKKEPDPLPTNVLAQLREIKPALFEALGERRLSFLSQSACERAPKYGIRSQADILKYLLLQAELGSHFDVDPALPWAAQTLSMRLKPAEKLSRLAEKASANRATKQESLEKTSVVRMLPKRAGSQG